MNSNPKPEHETCPHDNHLLDKTGKCWYCGGIYPVSRPALTVVNTEAQVEVEALETMTVDPETGEVPASKLAGATSGSGAMLTSERIEEIQSRSRADYACLDAPGFRDSLAARRDVAALLTDRTELQAEIERLREQTQKWVKDWEVECQRYEAALGIATSEHVALKAEIERLTKPDTHTCLTCVHWGTSMSAYPCLECGQHYDRSDLWEPAEEAPDA